MNGDNLDHELHLIKLEQEIDGFNDFIGSWVYQGDASLVFDVGPSASASLLLERLKQKGVEKVDYVLLSHIHLDHAGGLAPFLDAYPMARVVVHDKGIRHLVDPTRLWEGSLKTLGRLARGYGEISPVPREALIPHTQCSIPGVTVVETPGHAPHHVSYAYGGYLFAGEAGGLYFPMIDENYVRPATPPRFVLEQAVGSVDRLLELEDRPICYAHLGIQRSSREVLERFRNQLFLWRDVIARELARGDGPDLWQRCVSALLENDPSLAGYRKSDPPTQEREAYFIENGVRGYVGYLKEQDQE